jgi:hypothetical protein
MAYTRRVNRHVAYLQQKTVNGNANYVKRRPCTITALGGGTAVNLRVTHTATTYAGISKRATPDADTVAVYVQY